MVRVFCVYFMVDGNRKLQNFVGNEIVSARFQAWDSLLLHGHCTQNLNDRVSQSLSTAVDQKKQAKYIFTGKYDSWNCRSLPFYVFSRLDFLTVTWLGYHFTINLNVKKNSDSDTHTHTHTYKEYNPAKKVVECIRHVECTC